MDRYIMKNSWYRVKKDTQLGRSMIEMLGVLSIIGVLSVGGITAFAKMLDRYKINQTQIQINTISAKLSAIGSENSSFNGLDNKAAIKFGAVPNEAVTNAGTGSLTNLYNGAITIETASIEKDSSDNMAYTITYNGLSRDACVALASNDWGGEKTSLIGMGVSAAAEQAQAIKEAIYQGCDGEKGVGDKYVVACARGKTIGVPMTPVTAGAACQCASNTCMAILKFF